MPEGDTIYRTARALEKALAGRVVVGFEAGLAKLAAVDDQSPVVGRVVEKVEARGKVCLIHFSGDLILVSHMLMSGSWHLYRVGERWRLPRRAMRVVVRVGAGGGPEASCKPRSQRRDLGHPDFAGAEGFEAVLFNAQVAEFHTARTLARSALVAGLGRDVLGEGFTVEVGVEAMREFAAGHPEVEVGVALLNQRVLAGLGNVYKSEVAFAAGVNPFRAMGTVSVREMEKMVEFALRTMKANVVDGAEEGVVTYSGPRRTTRAMDRGDRVWVYGRQGQECRRCGGVVMMRKQGTAVRSTYWCGECQPWVGEGEAPVGKVEVVRRKRVGC